MRYLFLLVLLISLCAKADEIYRWRDAQGRVHYSESVPPGGSYEQLKKADLPPAHSAVPPDLPKSPLTDKNKTSTKKQRVTKTRHGKKSRGLKPNEPSMEQCRRYHEQLENIATRLRAGYREPTGNRLRAKRRQIEQRLRENC